MYMLVCPRCKSADIEKFYDENIFECHGCGAGLNGNDLKIITFDEYFNVDNTKFIDLNSENMKKMKNRLETLYCPNEFNIYVGCKRKCNSNDMKKCWGKVFERYDLLVSEESIYKFYCCGLHFAFKKKVK
ncbi:hypothetical protein [Clostridium perfringens]|uniref:hypothetical protein n=1 Tax=Clostridium perfringens TaxID=1502 RepID=UPI00096ABB9D|nr:hypothetical protein [Clostridium perfringens]